MVFFCNFELLLACIVLSQLGLNSARFLQQFQQDDKLNSTLCVWDDKIGCKANPLVKRYLQSHSFEEQQIIGASQCIVEDNPTDCNAISECNYSEDIDGNYNNIYDKPDRQMCVQTVGDVTDLSDFQSQYDVKKLQKTLRECFKPDSYWYTIFDCQSRDVCEGLCGEIDPELGGLCSPDLSYMNTTQRMMFLNSSLVLMSAIESGDSESLRQLAVRDISQNASYFCTSVFPVIFPCLGGIMGTADLNDCYLGNPAKFYWRDPVYLDMFDRSQKCNQRTSKLDCEEINVVATWQTTENNKQSIVNGQQLQSTNNEDDDGNFSFRIDIARSTLVFSFLVFVILFNF
eukprot:TRINITY_DN761_c0_g1_i4.p1 TRINITY_DN761_c0_g1~~TRINITY_DN761_c0_g1_i4.p1  ORF type:complete len:344 (-),score=22.69 TRINITY_DN761_c0_g1_i4:391-1422(-)